MMGDVLIVDDEPGVANGIAQLLERRGCPCRVALTSGRAVQAMRESLPGLVVLDLALEGGRSGWAVWDEVNAGQPGVPLRVLVHSALMTAHDRNEADRRGAVGIVRKSTPPRKLVDLILGALETRP